MLTLCLLLLSATPPETADAKIAEARRVFEQTLAKDGAACEKKHAERDAQVACADAVADAAIATYAATLRAGGAPVREALAKERRAFERQGFFLTLSEAMVAPELVSSRVRMDPDEADEHARRVNVLVSTAGIEPFEKELRAINPAWLWGDLERVAEAATDPAAAAAFFERVAANTFLPEDVRLLARVLVEHRKAKVALRTGVSQVLRLCRDGKRSLAVVRPATTCKPTTDARRRCAQLTRSLRGAPLPASPFEVDSSRELAGPTLACVQVSRDGSLSGGLEALSEPEETMVLRALAP